MNERFWAKVNKTDNCWLWAGAIRGKAGYGTFWWNGKMEAAHRVSYEIETGVAPGIFEVCHSCDNPPCVRPSHLSLGTQFSNMRDAASKHRMKGAVAPSQGFQRGDQHWSYRLPERQPRGSARGGAKLTEEAVLVIRTDSTATRNQLATRYGVHPSIITKVINRKIWTHI